MLRFPKEPSDDVLWGRQALLLCAFSKDLFELSNGPIQRAWFPSIELPRSDPSDAESVRVFSFTEPRDRISNKNAREAEHGSVTLQMRVSTLFLY